ncbi:MULTISPECIES: choice-of-anchor D domain-containing protein [unclassified Kaistella]|uniref:choice-of-anchor D domain-containing protein n=1 Tax=unclassified Kaistella TaxID=2762626 RepID=UPI0027367D91|nr:MULTISPECIES: choice-of-anchor D domain-containing protein [unclassified Kaistella]MDP2453806.1 choice-of-anchor D domain-containing protein [Kaistella sp. SH11-4b]MDP2456863.1 choice-of-anchor D domain-containing protein [Kaistella sp. SH40-3]MDP2459619.1 choice-of-anchor D domain-containing protein [Kaistella sp. SH19-2b]
MKKYLPYFYKIVVLCAVLFFIKGSAQTTLAQWTFPNLGTVLTPDVFSPNNAFKLLSCTQTISDVSGNGTKAATASGWVDGSGSKYWMIEVDTQGFSDVKISSEQRSSDTGPKDFKLQYRIGTGIWNDLPFGSITVADNFTSGVIGNLPIAAGSDLSSLFVRWVMTSNSAGNGTTVANGGTSRIDNIKVVGTAITATKPEPSNFPTNFSCGTATHSSIALSWIDGVGATVPDGYLIKWSAVSFAEITNPADGTPIANGANVQNVAKGIQGFTATGLSPNTPYFFKIWSYTNSGSTIDYKLVGEPQTSCSTLAAPCSFLEDFSNSNATTKYANGSFLGNNSILWTYTAARDEDGDSNNSGINGKGLMLRRISDNSKISSAIIGSGIANFSVKLYKGFTGSGNRQVELLINNISVATSIPFDDFSEHVFSVNNINVSGNVTIELRNVTNNQIIVDDLQWTCFTGTPEPNINIQGNSITIIDGDTTPSTADGTAFGTTIISGSDVEKTFAIQNLGSANLLLDTPAVVLLDGAQGFTVSVQPTINPMTGFTNQTFKLKFNNTVPGTYTETVMIGSNDPDTSVYAFEVKAVVIAPTITVDKTLLTGFTYPFGQGPSATQKIVINGSNLSGNINVTASTDWEISTNLTYDGGNMSPWNTIDISKNASNAVTNQSIHVRLKDGLAVGNYGGAITITSPNAVTQTVALSGVVTAGVRDIKVTGNGTSITNGSVTPLGLNNTLFAGLNLGNSQTKAFEIKNLGGEPLTIGSITLSGVDATSFSIMNGPVVGKVLNQNEIATFEIKFEPTTIGTKNATVSIDNNDPNDYSYLFAVRGGATYCSSSGELVVARQDFEISPAIPVLNYTLNTFGVILPGPNTGFSSGKSLSTDAPKTNNLYSEGARGYRIQGADPISQTPSGVRLTFDNVNTSAYTDISLSFKVAGFSLGSASNGMDDLNAANESTSIHDDKLDYVLVEISPDGGVTWYQQAKVVSGQLNLPWSFGSAGTVAGSRIYNADNNLTYFNSTSANRYSAINVTDLPAVSNLKVRISAQNNALNESWILDDVRLTSTGLVPKVWNGSAWLPSLPQPSDKAIINADYHSGTNGSFKVCQCEINSGATLTVGGNTEVKVSDFLNNNGNVVVESDGNFIQTNETDTNSGMGTFKVLRKLNLSATREQYNYLTSPTQGTSLKDIYKDAVGNAVNVPFILYHNEATNKFLNSSGVYIKGRALAVKEPTTATFATSVMTAAFMGQPANGSFNYNLVNSSFADPNRGYNLIGNPYPSNIDLIKFYADNSTAGNLSPTFYFWDHTANTQTVQMGDLYNGLAYANFNAATPTGTGTPTKAFGDPGAAGLKFPTRYVKVAQGFMAKVNNTPTFNVTFSNSSRKADSAEGFFGKGKSVENETPVDRYWLNLITPANLASNIAVVYFEEGNDAFTKDDSRSMGGSDAIYSLVENEKVSINGKSSFTLIDQVDLGTSHFSAGTYTIAIDKAEGVFANGQNIYLKDHQTGTVTNLTESNYTFEASPGETAGRFQIVYRSETVLVTETKMKGGMVVYRDGNDFVIKSPKTLASVEAYDLSGKLIMVLKPISKKAVLDASKITNGIYVLKITSTSGEVTTQKIAR